LGEVPIEVATHEPFGHDVPATLGVSGDALNVAAAGAHIGSFTPKDPDAAADGVPSFVELR
jgi:2-dehydro-3-deoxygluconokinase